MRSDPGDFEFKTPSQLKDVLDRLTNEPGVWRPLAGGTELMVQFGAGVLRERHLIDIGRLPELRGIKVSSDDLTIGAGCTFTDIRRSPEVNHEFPLLVKAASWTGSLANQNRATLGGNIVNASPAADSPPALLAYDAEIELISTSGSRRIPYSEFHLGYKKVNLAQEELVLAVRLPRSESAACQYLRKVGPRNAQAISKVALAGVGTYLNRQVARIRIAAASLASIPLRCKNTEQFLFGKRLDDEAIHQAKQVLMGEVSPIDDIRSTAKYRAQIGANLLEEFLLELRGVAD